MRRINISKTQDILKSNQTLKESDRLFTTMQGLGMSIKNMSKMKELGMSESTIKRKRRQLRTEGYLSRKKGSGRNRLIDEEKSYFILDLMKKNAFLSAPKIVKQLVDNYKDFNISATTVQRFLNEQGFKWKEPIVRVKNELLQRNQRLAFCNKNIDRDWSSVVFTDESSFYLHSPGISRWVPKGESNIIVKEKYSKKVHVWGAYWSKGEICLENFEGNMDSQKYVSILENNINKIKEMLPKEWRLQWGNDSEHKSNASLKFYIKNKIKLIDCPPYSPDLNPIENSWGNIKRYLGARTYKDIKSLKEDILDQWNKFNDSYWMYLTESMSRIVDTWILRNGGLTGY